MAELKNCSLIIKRLNYFQTVFKVCRNATGNNIYHDILSLSEALRRLDGNPFQPDFEKVISVEILSDKKYS